MVATLKNPKQWIKSLIGAKNSSLGDPSDWLRSILAGSTSSAGVSVTPQTIIGLSVVYSCLSIHSRTLATLPGHLYRSGPDGGKIKETSHSLVDLLGAKTNDEMTSVDFLRSMQANLSLHNNAYATFETDGRGQVQELWPIHPCKVRLTRDDSGRLVYEFDDMPSRYSDSILHIKGHTHDGLCGIDPTLNLRDVFGLAIALDTNAGKFFANGSRPGGYLEHPGKLTSVAHENLRKSIEDQHKGSSNAHKLMILEAGMKWANARVNNNDSQFDESRARQAVEICRIFGVPPHKVAILDNATYSNIEEQQIDWVQDGLLPICVTWEKAINCWLLTETERRQGLYWKFDLRGIMRGRMVERADYYQKAILSGWMNRNEARRLEDMNPADGLDDFLTPMNMANETEPAEDESPTNRLNGSATMNFS